MQHKGEHQNEIELKSSAASCPINSFDLIVIGAGPAGLFCAISSCPGTGDKRRILILEKNASPGRKLLISGSGQCNITHGGEIRSFLDHYGDQGKYLRAAILGFTNQDLVSYFESRGLGMLSEPEGKVFPQTRKARDVLDILLEDCRKSEIEIHCHKEVTAVSRTEEEGFGISCDGCQYRSPLLVIATGGYSYPATGSTGDGYRFARSLGHRITEIGPALTPLMILDYPFSDLAGISFENIKISLYHKGKRRERQGDVLFTHEGLSGPGVLDLSRYIRPGDILELSFVPKDRRQELDRWMLESSGQEGSRTVKSRLSVLPHSVPLPTRLIRRIIEISGIDPDLKLSQLRREERIRLVENLVGLPLVVSKLGGFASAMVTRGGVDWREVNPKTMQSRLVEGLYLAGEVLDIDGDTGGYNLQSCFSTGYLAGRSIKKIWEEEDQLI